MRIGIYGGSFNPVHNGHVGVARAAIADLALDRLVVIPAAVSPFKTDEPPHEPFDRLNLVRLAFAGMDRVVVDDRELRRGGVSYAIDTVRAFAAECPGAELFFIIGEDSVAGLPRWKDYETLKTLCTFRSYPRTKESSTEIRARLAKGEPVDDLVPPSVAWELSRSVRGRLAVLSLGSNIEPRGEYMERALAALSEFPDTRLVAASDVVETEPVDVPEAFRSQMFLNQVAIFSTALDPHDFSRRMHRVEDELGRRRTVRNGPRTVDIDLIDFEGVALSEPELTLPHPRALERAFVVEPWKAAVRRAMKVRRAAVPPEERSEKSRALCARLLETLGDARIVCCYEALRTELDLAPFVAACRARGVTVVFPKAVEEASGGTVSRRYVVERGDEVDLWICPGLAFTASGARLGFGGGWYDRFLAAAKPGARAYGVAYAFQLWPTLPQGPWDRRLDAIVVV